MQWKPWYRAPEKRPDEAEGRGAGCRERTEEAPGERREA